MPCTSTFEVFVKRETEPSPVAGYPGNVNPPFTWDDLRSLVPEIVVHADLVEFLEWVGTVRTVDIVLQADRGTSNVLKICRMMKVHTDASIHVMCASLSDDEIATANMIGVSSMHLVAEGYGPLAEQLAVNRDRGIASKPGTELVVGTIRIDLGGRKVFVASHEIPTTRTEFEILTALARQPGQIASRQELIEHVWGSQWFGAPNVLDTHVTHLRAKLLEAGCGAPIATVRGVGFYLDAPETPSAETVGAQAIA